jgi:pimeloyl-ACP methyl ester carboxylesterase
MKLFYRKYGKGPTFIIIHGLYGASDNWAGIAKKLSHHFEVYTLDQRNHGRSPHSPEHSYNLMKNDLLEFMDDHQIQSSILLGHSMGGKTAMHFASSYPERVNGLIVVDIAPKSYLADTKQGQRSIDHETIIEALKKIDLSKVKTRADADLQLKQDIYSEKVRQFLLKNLHRNKDLSFSWSLNLNALEHNLSDILEGIDRKRFKTGNPVTGFPVLFIRGANSPYIQDNDIPLIENIFIVADLVTVKDAGHWLHVEQPEQLVEIINEYFID